MAKVNLTINGRKVLAETGQTILQAARDARIRIPVLCEHPALPPAGACRICLVEIEGQRSLQPACTFPVAEGLVVDTRSPQVIAARKFSLELLVSDHPLDCMRCEAGGRCLLQDLAYEYGVTGDKFKGRQHTYPIDDPNPLIQVDRNKCILCGRCVRACIYINGAEAISMFHRGFNSYIGFGAGGRMEDSSCEFCGSCVAVCPTAALIEKKALGKGRVWQTRKVRTTCPYCGVGCQINLHVRDEQIVRVSGVDGAQPNQGFLCVKGRFGYDFIYSKERLTTPLIREGDGFREAGWDEALGLVAAKFKQIIEESGPDALAGVSCSRSINEDSYNMQKYFREVLGTNNIDNCART